MNGIRRLTKADRPAVLAIINAAAEAYRGVIPADRWHEPYMSAEELDREIEAGVDFMGYESDGILVGVMGTQPVKDVMLIRHAYVKPNTQRSGIGGILLADAIKRAGKRVLIGTWADANWAIGFYKKHGFAVAPRDEARRLLTTYWNIPDRQIETSVVLASVASS
jgi:N-acetylglutamate synthase-like GNAT family acetyltransferase